jgi:hypothetical protein
MMRRAATVLLALAGGCSALPQPATTGSQAADDSAAPAGELLLAKPPSGWQRIGGTTGPSIRTAEFVPDDAQIGNWERRITFEAMKEEPLPDPLEFLDLIQAEQKAACAGFAAYPTFAGEENGYPSAVSLLLCEREHDSGMSVATMIKTIRGNEFFYVITRAKRTPATAEAAVPVDDQEVAAWSLYLKTIRVCDTRDGEHPCPT